MISLLESTDQQIPLIHLIHEDDIVLLESADADWYRALYYFPWEEYRKYGASYYDALYEFNLKEAQNSHENTRSVPSERIETKEEAKHRLLFNRTTMRKTEGTKVPVLYQGKVVDFKAPPVDPRSISPGVVPARLGGKKPKCFFSLFKSFVGATIMGFPSEPESVHLLLTSNPSFVRACGFAPKNERDEYCSQHVPSLRKLEQFDQIMREWQLWDEIKWNEVSSNIKDGIIKKENELVGDTTHYYAYSGFETVIYKDENGKKKKKSQSKVTKKCGCQNKTTCDHSWELTDDGAGTIVKSNHKMYWGHKASVLGFPGQGIPLDAVAVSDAATHDGETFFPHVERLFNNLPVISPWIKRVLYDSACDSKELKAKFKEVFQVDLKASLNPRRKKEITKGLPRGIEKLTPYGVPVCTGGYEMDYKGMRYENEKFIYQAPKQEDDSSVCISCKHQIYCCPNSLAGRMINISFDLLPHIDPKDPPMAKRFKAIMTRRPSVERMIKRLKIDMGDDRLSKRGNASFQAYLDKTMIAFHIKYIFMVRKSKLREGYVQNQLNLFIEMNNSSESLKIIASSHI